MVPFAGYSMPVQYTGVLNETKATRSFAGLFDVSHMGQFWVRGKAALIELGRVTTNDLSRLKVGQAQYNMLCNDRGGVIDDIVVYRREEENFFICVNASNRLTDWEWLKSQVAGVSTGVSMTDESDDTALIALQGPQATHILSGFVDPRVIETLKYYWACEARFLDTPVYLSRTGYTGEDGFEIYAPSAAAGSIWDALLEGGRSEGLVACGLGARDTLRTEMGYPLHGHELSSEISPIEAGLSWVVKFSKNFVGKEALSSQLAGPSKLLRGFIMQDRRIARPGYRIFGQNREIGAISSGTFSPHLNAPIALGFIDAKFKDAETLEIQIREDRAIGRVSRLPFVTSHTKQTKV